MTDPADDMDFGELLGLEEGQEIIVKKDGEEIKEVKAPEEPPKKEETKTEAVNLSLSSQNLLRNHLRKEKAKENRFHLGRVTQNQQKKCWTRIKQDWMLKSKN